MSTSTKNKTLGILSSWTENCGNASYTKQLIMELSQHFKKVECIHLNQKLIHSGVKVDDDIINQVKKYDLINIQYEYGLFGKNAKKAHQLIEKVVKSHDKITITIHSYFVAKDIDLNNNFDELKIDIKKALRKFKLIKKNKNENLATYFFTKFSFFILKMIKSGKKIEFIVHRKELAEYFGKFGIPVRHHPIVSATNADIIKLNTPDTRSHFIKKYNLDESKTYIGIFGFLSAYKGFDVALDALNLLPQNYQLVMCCQRHPMTNKYINAPTKQERNDAGGSLFGRDFCADWQTRLLNTIITNNNLRERIHYINHLIDEEDFKLVIAGIDIPIFPYYEVGQGGSGPISYAIHLNYGGKIIASRTKAFEEYHEDYYPGCLTFFDQGNHIELSKKIITVESLRNNILEAKKNYGVDTNIKTYTDAAIATLKQ
ncbi:MAG: wbeA [Rickettsiaceae bacterium]|jgi:glycosyltransferase involved in cell wall biosynthesis|nr:wbeA [Rickettsiaceae bacterium]